MLYKKKSGHRWPQAAAACVVGAMTLAVVSPARAEDQVGNLKDRGSHSVFGDAINYVSHNLYFRFGAGYFDYYGSSSELKVENAKGLAAQAFGAGSSSIDGSGSSLGNKMFPSGTLGLYMPGTNHHLATEVTLSAPIKLDFQVSGIAANQSISPNALNGNGSNNSIPTGVPTTGRNIGTVKTLPPNISFVYRPFVDTRIQPYIGLGAMYLYTYDTNVSNTVLNSVNQPTLYLSKPWACTGKIGVDVNITDTFFVGAEAQYIGCATVKSKLNNIRVNAPNLSNTFGPVNVGTISSTNKFRAVIYQLSMGVRFD